MNALRTFLFSKDGFVVIAALIIFTIVSEFSTPYRPWINFLARIGNIAIFIYIIWRTSEPKIAAFFSQRREHIINEFLVLKNQRVEAENALNDITKSLTNLENEKQKILDESYKQANELKKHIIEEAQKEAAIIRSRAQQDTEAKNQEILKKLRVAIADEIISEIESQLPQQLTIEKQQKLITNALTKVVL